MHGLLRWNAGDRHGAVTAYRTAIGHAPRLWLARTNLAAAYAQSGMPREALAEARALALLYPGYPRSWLIQGIGLWQTGDPAGALRALEQERSLRDHPEAYYIESLVHRSEGNGSAEALALEHVLRRSLASGVTQHLAYAALRLPEAAGGDDRTAERLPLYEELARAFPGDSSVSRGYALFRGR
jgi:predicted Zn-dependent protease